MNALASQCAAVLAMLALASCAPMLDDGDVASLTAESAIAVPQSSSTADTLPPALASWPRDENGRGDGPLYPVADSLEVAPDWWQARHWGFSDADGRVVVGLQYYYATPMFGGFAAFAVEGEWGQPLWGYVNAAGRVVVAPRYHGAARFEGGRALVMIDDEFMFVDSTGVVVERLAPATTAAPNHSLPAPCDSCDLGEYARRLPRIGGPMYLHVQPREGESYRAIGIQRHPGGVLSVVQTGYEHWIYELRVPGITLDEGVALAKRILGAGQYEERKVDEPGLVLLDGKGMQVGSGFAMFSVRVRDGVVVIRHEDGV